MGGDEHGDAGEEGALVVSRLGRGLDAEHRGPRPVVDDRNVRAARAEARLASPGAEHELVSLDEGEPDPRVVRDPLVQDGNGLA